MVNTVNTHVQNQIKYAAYLTSSSSVLSPVFHKKLLTEFLIKLFKNNNNNNTNAVNIIMIHTSLHKFPVNQNYLQSVAV